jgi:TPR repeat protein
MSSLLSIENQLSLLIKLIIADINDVRYSQRQLLSSYSDIMRFLIKLLTQGCPSTRDRSYLMKYIIRRIIANMPAALYQYALALVSTGQCATAMVHLNSSIIRGHLPSRALKAWLMLGGREGVAQDRDAAFELVEEGARLGCHHCQGVMAKCYRHGYGCLRDAARSLELARESSGKGSRYGQFALGLLYYHGEGGVAQDYAQALALFRLAAAQNFDWAQYSLGRMYYCGLGVAQDYAEALRLQQLAAAQGDHTALYNVAVCHELGTGVRKNKAEAIRWYRRAQAAGFPEAADAVRRLQA